MATNIYIKQGVEFSDDLLRLLFFLIIVCILNRKFVKRQAFSYNSAIKKQHAMFFTDTLQFQRKRKNYARQSSCYRLYERTVVRRAGCTRSILHPLTPVLRMGLQQTVLASESWDGRRNHPRRRLYPPYPDAGRYT